MYGLIIGVSLVIFWLDVCLMASKKVLITDTEQEMADWEQMEYLEAWSRERKCR